MDTTKVKDALVQIALRMVPLIPGNELKLLFDALTKSDSEIETQVGEALKSLQSTSAIVSKLEASLKEKTERLKNLQAEYENYSNLTKITKEQVKSLSSALKSTLEAGRKERAFGCNIPPRWSGSAFFGAWRRSGGTNQERMGFFILAQRSLPVQRGRPRL